MALFYQIVTTGFFSGALKGCSNKKRKSHSKTSVVNPISWYRKALRDRKAKSTERQTFFHH